MRLTLLVPDKLDVERDAVAPAWEQHSGPVLRVGRFWDPPPVERTSVRLYGSDTFGLVLAKKLSLDLVSPPDRILGTVPPALLSRALRITTLDAAGPTWPVFIKPVVPKQFKSAVYPSREALTAETGGLGSDVEIIVSDVVQFIAEARAFVLDDEVQACAVYEGEADVHGATAFASQVARTLDLPRTVVVDVGLLPDSRWALVELNATWGGRPQRLRTRSRPRVSRSSNLAAVRRRESSR